jgi:glycosyltransferase involved in cell wall biosynthesis
LGGNPELVKEGVNGFLVPHNDPTALADRMNILLRDHDQARRFGSKGKQLLLNESYRRDFYIQTLIGEYQDTIKQFRRRMSEP